jgi:hypothetical protein
MSVCLSFVLSASSVTAQLAPVRFGSNKRERKKLAPEASHFSQIKTLCVEEAYQVTEQGYGQIQVPSELTVNSMQNRPGSST